MRKSIQISMQVFLRSVKMSLSWVGFLTASIAFLVWEYQYDPSIIKFLTTSLKTGTLFFAYFAFVGYEMGSYLPRAGGEECISAAEGASWRLTCAQIITLIIPLTIWSLAIFGIQVAVYSLRSVQFFPYMIHCFKAVMLYCFLPGLIGTLLGIVLSRGKQTVAYGVIILGTLVMSPDVLKFFSKVSVYKFYIIDVFDWFAISIPNSSWAADGVYGIAMETSRWILAAFWILLLLVMLVWRMRGRSRMANLAIGIMACLALICGVKFALRENDSLMRKDNRPDSTLRQEYNYRRENESGETAEADFSVRRYELNLAVKDRLNATATVYLEENTLSCYRMTLYHGFVVESVKDGSGNIVDFKQTVDHLEITTNSPVESLTIKYAGEAGKYFANHQGIALPGYFVYYPVPGHLQLWDAETGSMSVHTEFEETEFFVSVDSGLNVVSNLPEVEENQFVGTATSVTLYAGLIINETIDGVNYYYSPVDGASHDLDVEAIMRRWEELCHLVGETKTLELAGKDVFFQAETISTTNDDHESFVIFDDHVLVAGGIGSFPDSLCQFYLLEGIPNDEKTAVLKEAFFMSLYYSNSDSQMDKPDYEDLDMLKKYGSAGEITDRDEWDRYNSQRWTFVELLRYQIDTLGREYVLREVYEYLMSPDHSVNQVDFLYELGGGEDA